MVFKIQILYWFFYYKFKNIKTRIALEKHQAKLLKRHLKKIFTLSSFYKAHKHQNFEQLPIIDKSIFMANFNQINTVGILKDEAWQIAINSEESRDFSPMIGSISVGLSSGTTGNRGLFLVSNNERAHWVGAVLAKVVKPTFKKNKIAFFLRSSNQLYQAASNFIQFQYFDLEKNWDVLMEELKVLNPQVIVAQPSVLIAIAKMQRNNLLTLSPEKIVSVAEILEEEDQKLIEQIFGQKIHQVYQCTEGFLAHTCSHNNLHFNEDIVKIEFKAIDEMNNRYFPIITDLRRITQPVIRYCLNDIVQLSNELCPCGSTFVRIKKIEGRQDDMLVFTKKSNKQKVLIFPDFIRRIMLLSSDKIENYKVEQLNYQRLNIYLQLESETFKSIQILINYQFEVFSNQNDLETVELIFTLGIPFSPMIKNRRIINHIKDDKVNIYPYL